MFKKPVYQIKRYKNQKAFDKDANKLARKGWVIDSVISENPRSGVFRVLAIGLFAAAFRPKPVLVVTYKRGVPVDMGQPA